MFRALFGFILTAISITAAVPTNRLAFDSLPHARFEFTGPVGTCHAQAVRLVRNGRNARDFINFSSRPMRR